ncbi:MAG: MFS transporter [Halanaerobiales bacterium]
MSKKLFNRDFVLLWVGQAVSQLGSSVGFIAIMWWVQRKTGSALALGSLAMVQTFVSFLLSPVAGVISDRINRKWIIVLTDLIRGIVNCLFAYAAWKGHLALPWIFFGSAINAASSQFFLPSIAACLPQLVGREYLEKANSLREMTGNISGIFGYALGGVLVAFFGIPLILLLNGVSFILSALSELFIIIPDVQEKAKMNIKLFFDDLKVGINYIKNDKFLSRFLKVIVLVNFSFIPFMVLLPYFVENHLNASSSVFGYINSANTIGMLIGALILTLTSFLKRHIWFLKWGLSIQAAALFLAPLIPGQYWIVHLLIYGLFGLVNSIINISFMSSIQRTVDPSYMGKVFSLIYAVAMSLQPLASGLSGVITEYIGISIVFMSCAVLGVFSNILMARISGLEGFFDPLSSDEDALTA